jgi:hypothetical protein
MVAAVAAVTPAIITRAMAGKNVNTHVFRFIRQPVSDTGAEKSGHIVIMPYALRQKRLPFEAASSV